MNELNPMFPTIQCRCGEVFQVLNQEGTDWDEAATNAAYIQHREDTGH